MGKKLPMTAQLTAEPCDPRKLFFTTISQKQGESSLLVQPNQENFTSGWRGRLFLSSFPFPTSLLQKIFCKTNESHNRPQSIPLWLLLESIDFPFLCMDSKFSCDLIIKGEFKKKNIQSVHPMWLKSLQD